MIKSRMEAIFIISMHTMQNIIGVIRFSYGFHRTGSANVGLKLDIFLGSESFANILTDVLVMFLLWKEEKALGADVRPVKSTETMQGSVSYVQMTRVLGVFVAWNAVALHICAFGNLTGLLYPPKWYTNEDADRLSIKEKATILALWAPLIIFLAFWKLYYTSLLYEYYLFYKATKGRPFDYAALSRTAGSMSHPSAFSDDRRTFSATKTLNLTSEPARRHSIAAQYRAAVKQQAGLASQGGGSRRLSYAADERNDTAGATEMSQMHSRGSRRQSAAGAAEGSTAVGATRTRRQSVPGDNTTTIRMARNVGEPRRRASETAYYETGGTAIEDNAGVRYQPAKHGGATGAEAARKHSHTRKRSAAAEDGSNLGVPRKSRRLSEQGRRLSVAPDSGGKDKTTSDKAQKQSSPEDGKP